MQLYFAINTSDSLYRVENNIILYTE